MIFRDKRGLTRNTELIYAVEARIIKPNYKGPSEWFVWRSYKTMRGCLDALKYHKDCKWFTSKYSEDRGKTWHPSHWEFRPAHRNYTLPELTDERKSSTREKLLNEWVNVWKVLAKA